MAGLWPTVQVKETGDGGYAIGATIDKVFIPFATVSADTVRAKIAKAGQIKQAESESEEESE